MAYKLLDMAQARWRRLDGAHLLTLVRAGIAFIDGVRPEGKARAATVSASLPHGGLNQSLMNASRSALIVSACVVGMPCGKPL